MCPLNLRNERGCREIMAMALFTVREIINERYYLHYGLTRSQFSCLAISCCESDTLHSGTVYSNRAIGVYGE